METPVEGERNDVRVELIDAEPAELRNIGLVPAGLSRRLLIDNRQSSEADALYSRIGRSDKSDNGVVFRVDKGLSSHANKLTFLHRVVALLSKVHLPSSPLSLSAAIPAVPACDRADRPEPSHQRIKSKTLAATSSVEPHKAQQRML
ncbi:hypothetical protein OUZ56_017147 [Daphnia magna]|uniref:Uncharacterized protein n=1 Tax=Daphnia magna TaxID=35525 RepID=A0ABR0AS94_9CRUS|nr:hypothetical protein OUZ56_017147 [Daphnia magna]